MLENGTEALKLQEFLRKKNPQLNSEKVEKISNQLMSLAFFLVKLKTSQSIKPEGKENFNPPKERSP